MEGKGEELRENKSPQIYNILSPPYQVELEKKELEVK